MNKNRIKIIGLMLAMLSPEFGYAQQFVGTLGNSVTATDIFGIMCGTGTVKITYRIAGASGNPCVQMKATTPVGPPVISCGLPSPIATVTTGAGFKTLKINKQPVAAGAVTYTTQLNCLNATGGSTLSSGITYIQNQ